MLKYLKKIRERNGSPHARLILSLLFLEKNFFFKFVFRFFRVVVVQGIYHVELDPRTFDNESLCSLRLPHPYNIIVHGDSRIGMNCTLFHNVTVGARERRDKSVGVPVIGNNVFIGTGSAVVGNVVIGDNVNIGALSVVLSDVAFGTVCGVVK